jgi:predicted aminopeptidase
MAYYSQAVRGHLKLMNSREDIAGLVSSSKTDARLKTQLQRVQSIRQFASQQIGLPDNKSYKSYAATGKKFVTWNVVAADEFSVEPKKWCFPIAGCVSYKGYYKKSHAETLAQNLHQQGLDTTVNGATAYSTIGWFDDPVLDTMLRGSDLRLAGLIFHELAHQQLYIKGDSDFNEAYASFVEQEGVRAWLKSEGNLNKLNDYANVLKRRAEFSDLLLTARLKLQELYSGKGSKVVMRKKKQLVFSELKESYQHYKLKWNQFAGYDAWFSVEINNARLVSTATYRRLVPAFTALFSEQKENFGLFFTKTKSISLLDKKQREEFFQALLNK